MSRFTEADRALSISEASRNMENAGVWLTNFSTAISAVNSSWTTFTATYSDPLNDPDYLATVVDFRAKNRQIVNTNKASLAAAIDIIAAGMADSEGNQLTRQDLLDEIAAT